MSNFLKIRQMGAELFHAGRRMDGRTDGQTNMTKLIFAFLNFANALKKERICSFHGVDELGSRTKYCKLK